MDSETKYNVASCLVVISIIVCSLSFAAIFLAYPIKSCACSPIDANSVTVTILSIIVTILIGWNIYSALSIESKMNKLIDKVEKENRDFQEHINHDIEGIRNEQTKIAENMSMFEQNMSYHSLRMDCLAKSAHALAVANTQPFSTYRLFIHALIDALDMNDAEFINGILNNLMSTGESIIKLERKGEFIENEIIRKDIDEVEKIAHSKIETENEQAYMLIEKTYINMSRDILICIERIKYQIENKKVFNENVHS